MPDPNAQVKRVKEMRTQQAAADKETAADEAQMQVFEQQRDALYIRSREMNVEPQDIKQEILDRTAAIEEDLRRIEERFEGLRKGESNGA